MVFTDNLAFRVKKAALRWLEAPIPSLATTTREGAREGATARAREPPEEHEFLGSLRFFKKRVVVVFFVLLLLLLVVENEGGVNLLARYY